MFAKSVIPAMPALKEIKMRAPFVLPPAGEDALSEYVCGIKEDAPIDYENVGYIDFAKGVLCPEASESRNLGKHYPRMLPTKLLSEKQAQAILAEAQEREIDIPARPNLDYDHKDKASREYHSGYSLRLSEVIIFCRTEDFRPGQALIMALEGEKNKNIEPGDETEKVSEEIYRVQQAKKIGKK